MAAVGASLAAGFFAPGGYADDETMGANPAYDDATASQPAFIDDQAMVDPPDRVARVSFTVGTVSLLPADTEEWVDATVNRPLTNGDKLWIAADGRAELQAGTATIHLDENTGFSFVALDDDVMQMNLSDGAVAIEVRSLEPHERAEIDTPNATVVLTQPGEYTISTEESGDRTVVKTHSGEAIVSGADQHEFVVGANEQGVFTGNQTLAEESMDIGGRGPFETWAYQRNHAEAGSVAARYVAPGVVGYQDLDANGTWAYEPSYGQVWQPTTVVYNDWAPYRYGRWSWIQPWGWTWIDDAPWGFAPFHYGRWLYLRQRWCWLPGPIHARPVYAPALVAWSGNPRGAFGPKMGFANNVAWFPLGPRDVFMPGYRASWAHFRAVNASNAMFADNASLSNAYYGRNARFDYPNRTAITAVDRNAFARSQSTAGHRVSVAPTDVAHWQPRAQAPKIAPTHDAMLGARPVGHDPTPQLHRQITIVHNDTDDESARPNPRIEPRIEPRRDAHPPDRRDVNSGAFGTSRGPSRAASPGTSPGASGAASPGTSRVWQGSSLAYSQNRPPRTPAGAERFVPQNGAPRSADRPPNGERPQFHYNAAFRNNGSFQGGTFRDNGNYRDFPSNTSRYSSRFDHGAPANRPPDANRNRGMSPQPNFSQRPNEPTQSHPPAERPDVMRRPMPAEPPYHANNVIRQAPRQAAPAAPSAPASGRTMGQNTRSSNLHGAEQRGRVGDARNYYR